MALWFVSLYPDLGPSYANLILKGRIPDPDLQILADGNLPTKVMEEDILDSALRGNWDEFREMGFIFHPNRNDGYSKGGLTGIRFYPYIGYDEDSYWAFVKATYSGKDWIFFDQVIVLVGNQRYVSQRMPIFSNYMQRDVNWGSGGVTEIIDFPLSNGDNRALAYAIAYANEEEEVKVRFVGDTNRTFTLPIEVRWVWQDIIRYYDRVTQK